MTASAYPHAAFEIRRTARSHPGDAATTRLSLRATEDGWSLLTSEGKLVYRGFGLDSRHECLRRAQALGVLAVLG